MEWVNLIISLISGVAGGNLAGASLKDKSLGTLGNSIAGFFGGGIGAAILKAIEGAAQTSTEVAQGAAQAAPGLDIGSIIGDIASGGIGGGALLAIVSLIKNALNK
ncbi:MAG: hypothetical protein H0X29_06290 [Parachlamydiaceae bacterium]|nr:hypothetical protein [Parachlamydiaceae bacterium]